MPQFPNNVMTDNKMPDEDEVNDVLPQCQICTEN